MSRLISSRTLSLRLSKLVNTATENSDILLCHHCRKKQRDHRNTIFRMAKIEQKQQQYITTISEAKQILGLLSVDNNNNHYSDHKQRHEHHYHQDHLSHEHHHYHTQNHNLSNSEIRKAYYQAAKLCHPDATRRTELDVNNKISLENDHQHHQQQQHNNNNTSKKPLSTTKDDDNDDDAVAMVKRFHRITQAYELLISMNRKRHNNDDDDDEYDIDNLSIDEEKDYRMACQNILGLSAEIVEESKRSSTFRQWLLGKTDSAYLWRTFLSQYGGLVPKLRRTSTPLYISSSSSNETKQNKESLLEEDDSLPKIRRRRPRS